ncbi:flavin-containing monooxygenase [Nitriliruptor alkaliphilus]|uniref:flavin-containing monooxygenase n=1 Tax=Nitriliruptor alkaliphilus TaxID=427918 RepID=UPI000698504F|nr:NAD(P)-binding domain-containing protein [Nitriliruptor alkaliphilus]
MGTHDHTGTLVIGGGQAGLAVGRELTLRGEPFLIVDANARTGDAWRTRWDSLTLFTPNWANGLPGMPFPGAAWGFPTKDEVADYLEAYAHHFDLPIRHHTRVERLTQEDGRFVATAGDTRFVAENVVVAMAAYQQRKVPAFADDLHPGIVQLHVAEYRNPAQLQDGPVLIVGAGNSGAEIAMELVVDHEVLLSGPSTGAQPFRPDRLSGRILMPFFAKVVLTRVLSTSTPVGRKVLPKMLHKGAPLLRVKPSDLKRAGVARVARTVASEGGRPVLEDSTRPDVANVLWCTGFDHGLGWLDLPVFDEHGDVMHDRGVATSQPGLYFAALKFQHSILSDALIAVGRDAAHVVGALCVRRSRAAASA